MDKEVLSSPLITKYLRIYKKDPRSRVFAPLAESYRKFGMVEKALTILQEGIRHNPSYIMGHLGLAFCYYDKEQYDFAYDTLRPLINTNRDNVRLQRLFAEVCILNDDNDEALETYKYLLFINPKDQEIIQKIKTLEQSYLGVIDSDSSNQESTQFNLDGLESLSGGEDEAIDWVKVDFETSNDEDEEDSIVADSGSTDESWEMKKTSQDEEKVRLVDKKEEESVEGKEKGKDGDSPVVTHTLVDLYCMQGHIHKAIEVLEKILEMDPGDQRTLSKLEEIKSLAASGVSNIISIEGDEHTGKRIKVTDEGRKKLMEVFDQRFPARRGPKISILHQLEKKYDQFLEDLKNRSKKFRSTHE